MVLNDNILTSYAKFIDFREDDTNINNFKSVIEYGVKMIMEHLNMK